MKMAETVSLKLINEIGEMVEDLHKNSIKVEDLKTWEDDESEPWEEAYEKWGQEVPFDDS